MIASADNASDVSDLLQTQGPCSAPLDAAVEYLRLRIDRVLPMYIFAMAPHIVITALLISALVGERRSEAALYCLYLAGATLWRWVWISRLQASVRDDLQGQRAGNFWSRLPAVLLVRLYCNIAITWGSFLVGVPAFYGLFLGSFAAPLLLENSDPAIGRIRLGISWIQHSARRLVRISLSITVIAVFLTLAIFVCQFILTQSYIPSLLGLNISHLNVTLNSWSWELGVFYFVFLAIDCFWTVASVVIYYDSQSRRVATDLRVRLSGLILVQP
jgi:hypothetical protein